ncbi:hypothetical protein M0R45_037075 [Rubus argutus]|uniref:Transmembrane protein n=1 Tax=Rubus argutus TaxID=59490 RepID=A0AAW1W2E7_RUBAR
MVSSKGCRRGCGFGLGLTVNGGLLGFGFVDVIRSGRLIGSFWLLRLTGRWAWKGRMALLSTADVGWILLVLVWIRSDPFGWGYDDWITLIWGAWVVVWG